MTATPAALFNGVPVDDSWIYDRGLQFGDGVFATIAVVAARALCLSIHITRLQQACARLGISSPATEVLYREAEEMVSTQQQAVLKIIITRGSTAGGYACPATTASNRFLYCLPWRPFPGEYFHDGICLHLCRFRYGHQPALAGIKHLNRLEQVLARQEWSGTDYAEGMVMDSDGYVVEGTMSNVFLREGDRWFTPELHSCGVAGMVRSCILQRQQELGIQVLEQAIPLSRLLQADEVFVCNSLIGVWAVRKLADQCWREHQQSQKIAGQLRQWECIPPLPAEGEEK